MDSGSSTVLAGSDGGRDKLSSLGDATLGHILSYLPATEAARTATLSRRWRHVFAAVHTLSFDHGGVYTHFVAGVSAALLGRHRGARAATAPLRALRVAFDKFGFGPGEDSDDYLARKAVDNATKAVDGWLSYAVHGAGDGDGEALEIDLRLGTEPVCESPYALGWKRVYALDGARNRDYVTAEGQDDDSDDADDDEDDYDSAADAEYDDDDDNAGDADAHDGDGNVAGAHDDDDDDDDADYEIGPVGKDEYVVPRSLFTSCAVLRTLRLSGCRIDPPAAIALPSLDTLHLTRVTGRIQRLVSACRPSLVDLTIEACGEDLTTLSLRGARRLRRVALRCCHELATVVIVGTPELRALEYRGDTSPASLLTMRANAAPRRISFCSFDFCGMERGGELLFGLTELLAGLERLHLTSARLGSCFVDTHWGVPVSPCLPMLRVLEMTGMLPDDDESGVVATVARILEGAPRLETLSLFFLPEPHPQPAENKYYPFSVSVSQEVLDASHELRFDPHARLAGGVPPAGVEIPSCLREKTREINLVHYQGSVAQRALAKFLLCNAAVVDELCWKVARGPLHIQTKLMEEVRGWVMNKSANIMFF